MRIFHIKSAWLILFSWSSYSDWAACPPRAWRWWRHCYAGGRRTVFARIMQTMRHWLTDWATNRINCTGAKGRSIRQTELLRNCQSKTGWKSLSPGRKYEVKRIFSCIIIECAIYRSWQIKNKWNGHKLYKFSHTTLIGVRPMLFSSILLKRMQGTQSYNLRKI